MATQGGLNGEGRRPSRHLLSQRPVVPVRAGVHRRGVGAGMDRAAETGVQRAAHTLQQERWHRRGVSAAPSPGGTVGPQPCSRVSGSRGHVVPLSRCRHRLLPQMSDSTGELKVGVWGRSGALPDFGGKVYTAPTYPRQGASECCSHAAGSGVQDLVGPVHATAFTLPCLRPLGLGFFK